MYYLLAAQDSRQMVMLKVDQKTSSLHTDGSGSSRPLTARYGIGQPG